MKNGEEDQKCVDDERHNVREGGECEGHLGRGVRRFPWFQRVPILVGFLFYFSDFRLLFRGCQINERSCKLPRLKEIGYARLEVEDEIIFNSLQYSM